MILLSVLVYRKTFGEEADFYGKKNFESMRKVMRKEMRFLYIFLFEKVPIRFCKTDRQKCLFFTGLAYLTDFLISYFSYTIICGCDTIYTEFKMFFFFIGKE